MRRLAILCLFILSACVAPSVFVDAPRSTVAISPLITDATDLQGVQDEMNRMRYLPATVDGWKDPALFLVEGGDCEDYVVAKASALLALGYSREDMRAAVFADPLGVSDHMVLVVMHNGQELVLDNGSNWIYPLGKGVAYTIGFSPG